MTVSELLNRMSSREIAEWRAYYRIEYEDEQKRIENRKRTMPPEVEAEELKASFKRYQENRE